MPCKIKLIEEMPVIGVVRYGNGKNCVFLAGHREEIREGTDLGTDLIDLRAYIEIAHEGERRFFYHHTPRTRLETIFSFGTASLYEISDGRYAALLNEHKGKASNGRNGKAGRLPPDFTSGGLKKQYERVLAAAAEASGETSGIGRESVA